MDGFIPPHGGYAELHSYKKARIVYDGTMRFCERFLNKRDRTVDQMIQAARSGKQNILEGSQASGTSKETEIKLMNVARASLEELLEDYRDFLRTRQHPLWDKNSPEALFVRRIGVNRDATYESYRTILTAVRRRLSRTSSFASFTKPITCWTSKSARWRKPFLPKADFANA